MAQKYRNVGVIEAGGAAASYTDTTGAFMDYDGTAANFGAKASAGGTVLVKLRTMVAGVLTLAMTLTGANAAFAGSVTVANGLTVTVGTTAVQALTATSAFITSAGTGFTSNTTAAQANFNAVFKAQRNGAAYWWLSLDASDQFSILNAAGNANNLVITDAGAAVFRAGITATTATLSSVVLMNGAADTTSANVILAFADNAARGNGFEIVAARTNASAHLVFKNPNGSVGSIQTSGSATSFNTSSDERLKIDRGVATDTSILRALKVREYEWRVDGTLSWGVFAQEAYKVAPWAVHVGSSSVDAKGNLTNPWAVDYSRFVPDLIVGWQDHDSRIARIEKQLSLTGANV